jgi:hypothetical protein
MAAPPTLRAAARFLDRLVAIAEREGSAARLSRWIDPRENDSGSVVIRRSLCLKAIREVDDKSDGPEIFYTYPDHTEDSYLAATLAVFREAVVSRARAAAVDQLQAQEKLVGSLQLRVAQDNTAARRMSESANKVLDVGRLIDAPLANGRVMPPLSYAEWKTVVGDSNSRDVMVVRLKRTVYMREVNNTQDPELKLLMKLANGVEIVDAFAKGPASGRPIVESSLGAVATAILELRNTLSASPDEVWRYPPALAMGATALATAAGLPSTARNLTKVAIAWAQHERYVAETVVRVLNVAVLALLFLGPIGMVAADVLAVVAAVMEGALGVLKELDQDQAALATSFADDGKKLSAGGRAGEAALKGVLSFTAALAPIGLARVIGKTARVGAEVVEQSGSVAARDGRAAIRPATGAEEIGSESRSLKRAAGPEGGAPRYDNLDREWPYGPHQDINSLAKGEVERGQSQVGEEFGKAIRLKADRDRATKALDFVDMAGTPAERETFGRLTGRTLGDAGVRGAPDAATALRADVLRAAEADAASLRQRLKAHWDSAFPGGKTAEQAATDVLNEVASITSNPSEAGKLIRKKLFTTWRGRFLTKVSNDTQLVLDLRSKAGVVFNRAAGEGGNAFGVPFRDSKGAIELVGLDVDHAVVRHEEAVIEAFRTRDPKKLMSTIDSNGLQLLTERENRNFIEMIRKDNRTLWDWPSDVARDLPPVSPPNALPAESGNSLGRLPAVGGRATQAGATLLESERGTGGRGK